MKTAACSLALAVIVLSASAASAQMNGPPLVVWSKPTGPGERGSAASKPTPHGPSAHQLTLALADQAGSPKPRVRGVAFGADDQELTQFDCAYEQQDASGAWRRWSARVAGDSAHWRLVAAPIPEQ